MLIKLYQVFRADIASAREFVERDDLAIDRRMDVARRVDLTEAEVAVVLREDDAEGIRLIREQIRAAHTDASVAEAVGAAVERDIRDWLAKVNAVAWPGAKGPFVERVSPALMLRDDANGVREFDFTVHGWLFSPEKDLGTNQYELIVQLYKAGTTQGRIDAEVLSVSGTPQSTAVIRVKFPDLTAATLATYDLYISQGGYQDYPAGASRRPAAVTVCSFEVPFP